MIKLNNRITYMLTLKIYSIILPSKNILDYINNFNLYDML